MIAYFSIVLLVVAQLVLPMRKAFLPILICACHVGNFEVLPELTGIRLIILAGITRAVVNRSFFTLKRSPIDIAIIVFAITALIVSIAPRLDIPSPINQNLGLILNVGGSYLYGRLYLRGPDIVQRLGTGMAVILLPLAFFLMLEHKSGINSYFMMGAPNERSIEREGKIRAAGPFRHPILSGTCGATAVPFMFAIWRRRRKLAMLGLASSVTVVVSSASSGPLAAVAVCFFGMSLWKWRRNVRAIKWGVLALAFVLHLISTRGIWYLMAHMDLVGGSTGYHRAKLIDNAFSEFSKWWLSGTDYTRNWMFSGVSWSTRHTDITNYYIHLGVIGGVGLMGALIATLILSFNRVGGYLRRVREETGDGPASEKEFSAWCVGVALLMHAVSFLSISYFDQMFAVFYVLVGLASNYHGMGGPEEETALEEEPGTVPPAEAPLTN